MTQGTPTAVDAEAIRWAYRLFLDREPEDAQAVSSKESFKQTQTLRREFMRSDEFRRNNALLFHLSGWEPPLEIEEVHTKADLEKLFAYVQRTWQQLGTTEPHWSVLTSDEYRSGNIQQSTEKFYASGKQGATRLINTLIRNQIDYRGFQSCLEYGCGLGRITRWLANEFPVVIGCEISKPHLLQAKQYLEQEQVINVTLRHLEKIDDLKKLPAVDLIYSVLVLQHNPPPLIALTLARMLQLLKKGGVALFQVITYRRGYSFSLAKYLSTRPEQGTVEMHVLPQRTIFEIVAQAGARTLEVFEDSSAGDFPGVSNSFLVQKQ